MVWWRYLHSWRRPVKRYAIFTYEDNGIKVYDRIELPGADGVQLIKAKAQQIMNETGTTSIDVTERYTIEPEVGPNV